MKRSVHQFLFSAIVCAMIASFHSPSAFAEEPEAELAPPAFIEEDAPHSDMDAVIAELAPTDDEADMIPGDEAVSPEEEALLPEDNTSAFPVDAPELEAETEIDTPVIPDDSEIPESLPAPEEESSPAPSSEETAEAEDESAPPAALPDEELLVTEDDGAAVFAEDEADGSEENTAADEENAVMPTVTVGGVTLGDEVDNSGWNGSSGWRYDTDSVSLINNTSPVELHAEAAGVSLSVAGFNRISTLYADADVNITGTGILLIDSIDMLEGTSLNLLTNTDIYADGEGSVAVFVLGEDGRYYLVNGSVVGILDDEYTIPAGIELVVPEGGQLSMQVIDSVILVTWDSNGKETDREQLHYGITDEDRTALYEHDITCYEVTSCQEFISRKSPQMFLS